MYWPASIKTADLCDLMTFERLEALVGWNNSLIPASTYYSKNYSQIIGTGLDEIEFLQAVFPAGELENLRLKDPWKVLNN